MGRYLKALKKAGNGGGTTLQNLQNPIADSFVGFVGTPPPPFEINQAANDDDKHVDKTVNSFAWLIHFSDRDPLTVTFSPEVTHAEALAFYPDAVAAEPIPEPVCKSDILDDRITCRQCSRLTYSGVCSIAAPGAVVSTNCGYRPAPDLPQRCEAFNEREI